MWLRLVNNNQRTPALARGEVNVRTPMHQKDLNQQNQQTPALASAEVKATLLHQHDLLSLSVPVLEWAASDHARSLGLHELMMTFLNFISADDGNPIFQKRF